MHLTTILALALSLFSTLATTQSRAPTISSPTSTQMPSATLSNSSATSSDTSPPYTITALPALRSAPPCIFNCLIPVGLADPSGCDDVSNDCACLSAPADVLDALTDCANTVCKSSTSAYGASATSLFQSYCRSLYGTMSFEQAFSAESSANAASSLAAAASNSSMESVSVMSATATAPSGSLSPSASAKSEGGKSGGVDSIVLFNTLFAAAGVVIMFAL